MWLPLSWRIVKLPNIILCEIWVENQVLHMQNNLLRILISYPKDIFLILEYTCAARVIFEINKLLQFQSLETVALAFENSKV